MRHLLLSCVPVMMLTSSAASGAPVAELTAQEASSWQLWLCPLPREVSLTGKVTVPVAGLRVRLPAAATDLDRNLLLELAAALEANTGAKPDLAGGVGPTSVVLDFRRRADDEELLGEKPNADQAYCLEMTAGADAPLITCHALTEHGSYFGMKTLKQLLLPTLRGDGEAATVDVPLGRIVDWPDLEERGQWGGTAVRDLDWLTDLKYNLLEVHASLKVDEDGVGHATMNPDTLDACRRHGVRVVPIIHHLEQLTHTGLFEAYPMIEAAVDTGNPNQRVICFAQPEIVKPLSDWLRELGEVAGVTEVMIWLSEEGKGCRCEQCAEAERFVQELEACVRALRVAQESCPELGLRVLLSQGSYATNDKVLQALPDDVKVSYYHGGLTYNTERKPMIYPALEPYLAQRRWMGVYPTLSSNWLTVAPFSNPEFTHYRLTEFVDKGLRNVVAYIVPTALYYRVNTEGGLEWAWNAHGRTPREFAGSFAVRHGLGDPEVFARWTELIGPAAWDLYASSFPYLEHWGAPVARIAAGRMRLGLGQSIFAAFTSPEQFEQNLQRCDEALRLAEEIGAAEFIAETKIVRGYTRTLQAVYQLSRIMHGDEGVKQEDRETAQRWFAVVQEGLDELIESYPPWSEACQVELGPRPPTRFASTLTMMEKLAARMGGLMEECGFVDRGKPYRLHVIGSWKTEDFAPDRQQTRRLEVTELVDGPGTYTFRPAYRSGTLGLVAHRVALVSFPKQAPEEIREEAVDQHTCHAGAWVENDVYTLTLEEHDPARGYAVVAHIAGGDSTNGDFLFRKLRR